MEEVAEDGKESTNSAHANGMNEFAYVPGTCNVISIVECFVF
jgi:hypothetical protein